MTHAHVERLTAAHKMATHTELAVSFKLAASMPSAGTAVTAADFASCDCK